MLSEKIYAATCMVVVTVSCCMNNNNFVFYNIYLLSKKLRAGFQTNICIGKLSLINIEISQNNNNKRL